MSKYFRYYPQTQYAFANGSFTIEKSVKNISLKTVLKDGLSQDDPYIFLRYTISEDEKAEDIADFYYDDPAMSWLVYFANDIVDPYTQWPKTYENFTEYFRKKYASQALPTGTDAIVWGQNATRTDNIVHWKNTDDETMLISPDSYIRAQTFNGDFVAGDWTAVRRFDYEMEENENMRNILLVNTSYAPIVLENLRSLLNG
tara:strand:+ start:2017 stop:2619 length:603 start_codon:yes stop_codon:yes gene_type:complete